MRNKSSVEARRKEIREELYRNNQWIEINRGKLNDEQVNLFLELAGSYLSEDKYDYPKAMAIYQYVKKVLENKLSGGKGNKKQIKKNFKEVNAKIESVESKFLALVGRDSNISKSIKKHKEELDRLRSDVKSQLKNIKNMGLAETGLDEQGLRQRATQVEEIYKNLRDGLIGSKGIFKGLLEDCIEELGRIPIVHQGTIREGTVKYCILAMGSMALGTATPWSGFEHNILIESNLLKEDEERVKTYFRDLTLLMYIKIVNFGETLLSDMSISELSDYHSLDEKDRWFLDRVILRGIGFDGEMPKACKSPLGGKIIKFYNTATTVTVFEDFELICTAEELARFQEDKKFKEAQELLQALRHVIPVIGDKDLAEDYQKRLKEPESFTENAFLMLQKDLLSFNPNKKYNHEAERSIVDVKKEMYRFPDRVIASLSNCFGVVGESSWELIRQLQKDGKLSEEGRGKLSLALSIAVEIRLRTYASNNGQKENRDAILRCEGELEDPQREELIKQIFHVDSKLLYVYYGAVLPLVITVQDIQILNDNLLNANLFIENPLIKGMIHRRLLKYTEAVKEFETIEDKDTDTVVYDLAFSYFAIGQYEEALKLWNRRLELEKVKHSEKDHADIAKTLNNIGNVKLLRKPKEALESYKKSLEMYQRLYNNGDHADIAKTLNNIGNVELNLLRKRKEALEIAKTLNNIGNVKLKLRKGKEALESYKKSLAMYRRLYNNGDHIHIANILYNIGSALSNLSRDWEKALESYKKSLAMYQRLYNNGDHTDIAKILNDIGCTLENSGNLKEALEKYKQSLEMKKKFFQENHPSIVLTHNNLVKILNKLAIASEKKGNSKQATQYRKELERLAPEPEMPLTDKLLLGLKEISYFLLVVAILYFCKKQSWFEGVIKNQEDGMVSAIIKAPRIIFNKITQSERMV